MGWWSHAPLHHKLQFFNFISISSRFWTHSYFHSGSRLPTIIELWHDRNSKTGVRTSKDPKQPGHPPSMVRFFTARPWATKGLGIFSRKVMTSIISGSHQRRMPHFKSARKAPSFLFTFPKMSRSPK